MNTDGQAFLNHISDVSDNKFEIRFSRISTRLELGAALSASELSLLYEAAFLATICNISINGLTGVAEANSSDRERVRVRLEWEFMEARNRFFACPGVRALAAPQIESIQRIFLNVVVSEENIL
jgi:hypothetical protein